MESNKFRPQFFSVEKNNLDVFQSFKQKNPSLKIVDSIESQLLELIKILNPSAPLSKEAIRAEINQITKVENLNNYGNWVYYPWNKTVVHLLPEAEFIKVRTNRNLYKISPNEYQRLQNKRIGIVGLSVGSSIAITMAQERIFSQIRLADFDELELSNCNRINTSVCNLGLEKVVITARQIAEIDPYLDVLVFPEGITDKNINQFLLEGGGLDLLLDECDEIAIKIKLRLEARKNRIPVIMDTSDRGLIDVERFELEPNRPIFHGLLGSMDLSKVSELKTAADKLPYILPILGIENLSTRGKASMLEIGETINTWPQLASSIALGAGATVDTSRRLLSGKNIKSGRYYVDVEEIIPHEEPLIPVIENETAPLSSEDMSEMTEKCFTEYNQVFKSAKALNKIEISNFVEAAILAPTSGNDQPWRWVYKNKGLFLFHDKHYSESYGDFLERPSMIGLGSALENLRAIANSESFKAETSFFPIEGNDILVALVTFKKGKKLNNVFGSNLNQLIKTRCTNRSNEGYEKINDGKLKEFESVAKEFGAGKLQLITDRGKINELGEIIGECDRIRLFNSAAYHDFVKKEIRWTEEELQATKTGNDFKSLQLGELDSIAIRLIKEEGVIDYLKKLQLGKGFTKISQKSAQSASVIGLITMPSFSKESFLKGGMLSERIWLKATGLNIAMQPLISPIYFFMRLIEGRGEGLSDDERIKLKELRKRFEDVFPASNENQVEVFLFRLNIANDIKFRSIRRELKEVFEIA